MGEEPTHFDEQGNAWTVDVGGRQETNRTAVVHGLITVSPKAYQAIMDGIAKKGDVLGMAQAAGIVGAKKTSELIPLCHALMLTRCAVELVLHEE